MNGQEQDPQRDELHQLLGAYVLGGLTSDERRTFEEHLPGCPDCSADLGKLARLPELLDAVEKTDALALAVPRPSADAVQVVSLMHKLARRRRTRRIRGGALVAALAAACLALGAALQPVLFPPVRPDETYSVTASSGLTVDLGLVRKAWGTELSLQGSALPREGTLSLWTTDRAGHQERVCSWGSTPAGRAKITSATPLKMDDIVNIAVRDQAQHDVAVVTMPDGS